MTTRQPKRRAKIAFRWATYKDGGALWVIHDSRKLAEAYCRAWCELKPGEPDLSVHRVRVVPVGGKGRKK